MPSSINTPTKHFFKNNIRLFRAKNQSLTLSIQGNDNIFRFLHSTYNPEKEAQDMLSKLTLNKNTVYLIYGFGAGYHVLELLKVLPQNSFIFIIEPSQDIQFTSFFLQNHATQYKWLLDKRIITSFATPATNTTSTLKDFLFENGIAHLQHIFHQPTVTHFAELYQNLKQTIENKVGDNLSISMNFLTRTKETLFNNAWENFCDILTKPSIAIFKNAFTNVPAIIISSGPSLEKNIHLLKQYTNRAVLIASGSALGALKEINISPHFLCAISPYEYNINELTPHLTPEITMITPYTIPNALVKAHKGNTLFFESPENDGSPTLFLLGLQKYLHNKNHTLHASICVASTALFFAHFLGCNPIIFVGQDLAMSKEFTEHYYHLKKESKDKGIPFNNVLNIAPDAPGHHAKGSGAHGWSDAIYCEVEGQNQEKLITNTAFSMMIDLFNEIFPQLKNIGCTIINATEGGANIKEATNMTLKDVEKKFLQKKHLITNKIGLIFKKHRLSKINYLLLEKELTTILNWNKQTHLFWQKEHENILLIKNNSSMLANSTKELKEIITVWDDKITTLSKEENYIFLKSYLLHARWYYFSSKANDLDYTDKFNTYFNFINDVIFVTTKLETYLKSVISFLQTNFTSAYIHRHESKKTQQQ